MRAPLLLLAIVAWPALAAPARPIAHLFVEQAPPGAPLRLIPVPERLRSGERIVVVVSVERSSGLIIVHPVPAALRFAGARGERLALSVDSGRSFGRLPDLTVTGPTGRERAAGPADVTHVRWSPPEPAVTRALFSFRAVVR